MEGSHGQRRSASNGSLHSAYSRHGGRLGNFSHPRPPSQRRPLRSLNETASILRSPGPLESMLKTTTETGDIGIFSIGPGIPPSPMPATYHQPPRPRMNLKDANLLPPPRPRIAYDEYYSRDDRRRLPSSYRDTTSEIISLYACDTQPSYPRSFSPSLEDGRRSYSLTTCSSRHMNSQKSSGTLQSHGSSAGLQRPRSPFPYPTRLRRPGVRPSSPAVTENGVIDYTRMVELDRVSHRTMHGSYRPSHFHGPRRPPPLALRPEANRSTSSLPTRSSPGPYCYGGYGPGRSRTPTSPASWAPRLPYTRRPGSADQSIRSGSLTSIVEMYQRPMTTSVGGPPQQSPGPFYYDYSEEFEKQFPLTVEPLCPIPQRAGSVTQPMILRDETRARFDRAAPETDPEVDCYEVNAEDASPTASSDNSPCHGREMNYGALVNPTPDIDEGLVGDQPDSSPPDNSSKAKPVEDVEPIPPVGEDDDLPALSVPSLHSREVGANEPRAVSTEGVALAPVDPPPEPGPWRRSKTLGPESIWSDALRDDRASQTHLARLRNTWDIRNPEFAAILASFDRLVKSPQSKKNDNEPLPNEDHADNAQGKEKSSDLTDGRNPSGQSCLRLYDGAAEDGAPYKKKHRCKMAATKIKTECVEADAESDAGIPEAQEKVPILSPEPISPARQLRVKNSIPQLMKALPPLPADARRSPNGLGKGSSDETSATDSPAQKSKSHSSDEDQKTRSDDVHRLRTQVQVKPPANIPKFKLRIQTSSSSISPRNPGSTDGEERSHSAPAEKGAESKAKPRLKLKVAKGQPDIRAKAHNGTVIRSPELKQCNSLAELDYCSGKNMFTSHDEGFLEATPRSASGKGTSTGREGPSPKRSDQFNIPYPPSPSRTDEQLMRSSISTNKLMVSEMRSFRSDAGSRGHRGIRQKMSMLRLRLGGPQKQAPTCGAGTLHMVGDDPGHGRAVLDAPVRSGKRGERVRRWAKGAKRAVRACVRRTLDRSSRDTN